MQPNIFSRSLKVLQLCGRPGQSGKPWAHPRWMDLLTEAREEDANGEHSVRPAREGAAMAEPKMGQEDWGSYDWDRIAWNYAPSNWDWMWQMRKEDLLILLIQSLQTNYVNWLFRTPLRATGLKSEGSKLPFSSCSFTSIGIVAHWLRLLWKRGYEYGNYLFSVSHLLQD